jgi:hypothetical protein
MKLGLLALFESKPGRGDDLGPFIKWPGPRRRRSRTLIKVLKAGTNPADWTFRRCVDV